VRRILCLFPRYAWSFGTFHHAYRFFGGRVRAFMPAQGLLVGRGPPGRVLGVRFVDQNIQPVTARDLE
jgi:hopanoid C-2 methylase